MISRKIKKQLRRWHNKDKYFIDFIFREYCRYGEFEFVRYLWSHSLYRSFIVLDYDERNSKEGAYQCDNPLVLAACNGHFNVVKFLLEKNETGTFSVHDNDNRALRLACNNGHLKIIKYLLTSKKIKENSVMDLICLNFAYERNHQEVVNYILENYKVEELASFPEYIGNEKVPYFKALQNSLQLSKTLNENLEHKNVMVKNKIKHKL